MNSKEINKRAFRDGLRDGLPIGLGYLAVSFSLGIAARNVGLDAIQSFFISLLCNASAGEYAGISLIGVKAAYIEVALMTLIANARYLLMSCAMSQRVSSETGLLHRLVMSFFITDEIFAVSIARPGYLNPCYSYGVILTAAPFWAFGTSLGAIAGNLLPLRLVSAFSVALYGMFLAVIVPPARKDKILACLIVFCFAVSFAATYLPVVRDISAGTRTIIITVVISSAAALLFPKKDESEEATENAA